MLLLMAQQRFNRCNPCHAMVALKNIRIDYGVTCNLVFHVLWCHTMKRHRCSTINFYCTL
jgi:hypothetical protein